MALHWWHRTAQCKPQSYNTTNKNTNNHNDNSSNDNTNNKNTTTNTNDHTMSHIHKSTPDQLHPTAPRRAAPDQTAHARLTQGEAGNLGVQFQPILGFEGRISPGQKEAPKVLDPVVLATVPGLSLRGWGMRCRLRPVSGCHEY